MQVYLPLDHGHTNKTVQRDNLPSKCERIKDFFINNRKELNQQWYLRWSCYEWGGGWVKDKRYAHWPCQTRVSWEVLKHCAQAKGSAFFRVIISPNQINGLPFPVKKKMYRANISKYLFIPISLFCQSPWKRLHCRDGNSETAQSSCVRCIELDESLKMGLY